LNGTSYPYSVDTSTITPASTAAISPALQGAI
jgi:hypothetical protein